MDLENDNLPPCQYFGPYSEKGRKNSLKNIFHVKCFDVK